MLQKKSIPYVDGTSKKLWCIPKFYKTRSTFFTESTLCKLLCNPKDQVSTEIDSKNCKTVCFSESKQSLKSRSGKHKRSVRNCDWEKTGNAKRYWELDHNFTWYQKKVVNRESRLIPMKNKRNYTFFEES